jgi:hypothetical protein
VSIPCLFNVTTLLGPHACMHVCLMLAEACTESLQTCLLFSRDACFCFTRKSGYSGVATYSRSAVTTVRAAEEGLLRVLPPQNPVCAATMHVAESAAAAAGVGSQAAAGSAGWPREIVFPAQQLRAMFTAEEALAVDKDGRCIITGDSVSTDGSHPSCTHQIHGHHVFDLVFLVCADGVLHSV